MSTRYTNAANRERAYTFQLPTFNRADVLISYRPDPGTNLLRKAVPSSVVDRNPAARAYGPMVPSITRTTAGETVLASQIQAPDGTVVNAPGIALNVYRRQELVPMAASAVPGVAAAAVPAVKVKPGMAGKIAIGAVAVIVAYHLFF